MEVNSERVAELSNLTGRSAEQAQFFLEAAGGDFQQALEMCKEQDMDVQQDEHEEDHGEFVGGPVVEAVPQPYPRPRPPPQPQPVNNQRPGFLRSILRLPITLVSGTFGILGQALSIGLQIFFAIFGRWMVPYSLLRRLLGLRVLNQQENDQQIEQRVAPSLLSPQQEAELFLTEFQRNFGSICPSFEISSWTQATNTAHQQGKITLVILSKFTSQEDRKFCQSTLCRQEVVTFINDNFICWGSQVEGESVGDANALISRIGSMGGMNGFRGNHHRGNQQQLQIQTPMCLLLGFSGASLQVVSSQHGFVSPEQFMEWLMHAQEVFQPRLEMEYRQQQEREVARLLREEQDAAYVESLKLDQMKQEEKERQLQQQQEEERMRLQEIERARQLEEKRKQEAEMLKEQKEQRRALKKSQLSQEPSKDEPSAMIRIKLPDGSTAQRRFFENDKVSTVFDYVESLDNLTCWNFNLVIQYPQKEFSSNEAEEVTIKDAGLCPSAVLYVKPQDD